MQKINQKVMATNVFTTSKKRCYRAASEPCSVQQSVSVKRIVRNTVTYCMKNEWVKVEDFLRRF